MHSLIPAFSIFLISPALSMLVALTRIVESKNSRNILWAFCCFYGFAFYLDLNSGVDAIRYREMLVDMHRSGISFSTLRSSFYEEGQLTYDLYQPIVTFLVSRVTDNFQILYGIFGFVFGYFYSRVIGFFIDQLIFRPKPLEYLLLFSVAFTQNIGSSLNGVRMYTALFVFLFGALYYWQTSRKIYLAIAVSSVFVHFSYALPIALLIFLPSIQRLSLLVYLFFVGSFVFTTIQLEFLQSAVQSLPLGIDWRVRGYLQGMDPDRELPFVVRIDVWLLRLFRIVAVTHLFLIWNRRELRKMIPLIFCMTLVGIINLLGEVGSISRFLAVCDILLIGQILIHVNENYDRPESRMAGGAVACLTLLHSLLGIRFFLGYSSMNLLIGNLLTIWFFEQPDRSLYDYLPKVLSGL